MLSLFAPLIAADPSRSRCSWRGLARTLPNCPRLVLDCEISRDHIGLLYRILISQVPARFAHPPIVQGQA